MLRWRLFLEEYTPIFHYIKGQSNTLADALSRLPLERQNCIAPSPKQSLGKSLNKSFDKSLEDDDTNLQAFYSFAMDSDDSLLNCFAHLPALEGVPFVLDYATIAEAQSRDASLQALAQVKPQQFARQLLAPNTNVICKIDPNGPWKICLPDETLEATTKWYHLALGHVGMNRLYDTISLHFYHRAL